MEQFKSVADAKKAFRRKRTIQYFRLDPKGPANPVCACCGHRLKDQSGVDDYGKPIHPPGFQGSICHYYPKSKTVKTMHYTCAWGATLAKVANIRSES